MSVAQDLSELWLEVSAPPGARCPGGLIYRPRETWSLGLPLIGAHVLFQFPWADHCVRILLLL
jgi:hypothetical protein